MSKQQKVIREFETACKNIIRLFDKKEAKEFDYKDIDTFEDALDMVEDSQTTIGDTLIEEYNKVKSIFPEGTFYNALAQMRIIVFAVNGCDESFPDWKNESQEKRCPWFYMDKSGVGFSFYDTYYAYSSTTVGSRLVFKDAARTKYVAEHRNFKPIYKIVFNQ